MQQSITSIPVPQFVQTKNSYIRYFAADGLSIEGDTCFAHEMNIASEWFSATRKNDDSIPRKKIQCKFSSHIQGDESYELEISETAIEARAINSRGMFHALSTLRQLALSGQEDRVVRIHCALIRDRPRFAWRGFMLDSSRYFYSPDFIMKMIDVAAMHHLNTFHWHLTDDQGWRLPVDRFPKLTSIGAWREDRRQTGECNSVGGFYEKDAIRNIVAYAAARHIEVVPEIDLPGHASAILASYPDLGCTGGPYHVEDRFGIFDDVLCAGNDNLFVFFDAVFETLDELFPSPYVHIGGDEVRTVRWEACPKCRKKTKEENLSGAHQLQSWITVRLAKMLAARGKTAIGWDEVLEGTDRLGLPENLVVMSWRGREGGMEASSRGHRVIMSPLTDGCYLNFKPYDAPEEPGHLGVCTVAQSYSMEPAPQEMSEQQAALVLGGQCNLWSEVIYAGKIAEYMLFPRMSAIAEALWSPRENRDIESFKERLADHRKRLDRLDVCQYRGALE